MRVPMTQIDANPFRDIGNYNLMRPTVDSIKESVGETGYWKNIPLRVTPGQETPKGYSNMTDWIEQVETLPPDDQLDVVGASGITFQQQYGHHRFAALEELEYSFVDAPIIQVSDTVMLKIMCNENKDTYAHSPLVLMESVQQVLTRIENQVADTENWTDYKKKYDMLKTKGSYDNVKKQGAGIKTLHTFLGETWARSGIQAALGALAHINNGVYDKTTIASFPSIDAINRFNMLVTAIMEGELPPLFQQALIKDCAAVINSDGASGKTIDSATGNFKKGNDPVAYLKDQMPKPLKLKPFIKEMIRNGIENFDALEGFDTEAMKALVADAKKEIEDGIKREAREAAREAEIKKLMDEGMSEEEAIAKVRSSAPAEDGADAGEDSGTGSEGGGMLTDEDEMPTAPDTNSVDHLISTAYASVSTTNLQASRLIGKVHEIDPEKHPEFITEIHGWFETATKIMGELEGFKSVRARVNALARG